MRVFVNESQEDYLETILVLSRKFPAVRAVDIANEMGFKKSSVSIAMKNLREQNYVALTEQGFIELTEAGRALAESVYEKHEFLRTKLIKLGVSEEIAALDACRIEHVISDESFEAIKNYIKELKKNG